MRLGIGGLILGAWIASVAAADASPAWLTETTVAEVGRFRVIPLTWDAAADHDRAVRVRSSDPRVLEVLTDARVLTDHTLGFVSVRGLRPGVTTLQLPDGPPLRVEVCAPRADLTQVGLAGVEVTSPAPGAAVWGTIAVAAEVTWHPQLDPDAPPPSVTLHVDQRTLDPVESKTVGPHLFCSFDLDTARLRAGRATFEVRARYPDGAVHTTSHTVEVWHPADGDVHTREAEDPYDGTAPTWFPVDTPPRRLDDPTASGGVCANNNGARPVVCWGLDLDAGTYQLIARAKGTRAHGALPTVALYCDDERIPLTQGTLARTDWHRVAIGAPITLTQGAHALTPYFANDYYLRGLADRNLRLDRLELLRVGGASAGGGMGMMMAPGGGEVTVAFQRTWDGRTIRGDLELEGLCKWEGDRPPWVWLELDGRPLQRQRSAAPRFFVDRGALQRGPNRLQLAAQLPGGPITRTPVQTVHLTGPSPRLTPRRSLRFTWSDPAWDAGITQRLEAYRWPRETQAAALYSARATTLTLPPDLQGRFEVWLEVAGTRFEGIPHADVELLGDGDPQPVGRVTTYPGWSDQQAGQVELRGGAQQLRVAFTNDHHVPDQGDRNLFVQSLFLREISSDTTNTAPWVELVAPRPGEDVWDHDAVVVAIDDDRGATWAEVVVDGRAEALRFAVDPARRYTVLPWSSRDLAPGPHQLSVRVGDAAGAVTMSASVEVRVLAAAPTRPTRYARAVHTVNRLGWGPDPEALADALVQGPAAWVASSLRAPQGPGAAAARGIGSARFPNGRAAYHVQARAVEAALLTRNPVRSRWVLWVENHLSTWIRKSQAWEEAVEHDRFAALGAAPFPDLLLTSATSPAMLRFLDQERSVQGAINENYARELLELHTLGVHGGYTQADVTALARVLAGWGGGVEGTPGASGRVESRRFRCDPALNAGEPERVAGFALPPATGNGRSARVLWALEWLAGHPSTAHFVCAKLVEHTVAVPAPEPLVARLAQVYLRTHGDMAAVVTALVADDAFYSHAQPRLQPPLGFALRLYRTADTAPTWLVMDLLGRTQAGVFDRPTPDGYPEDDALHADTNALLQRWRLARRSEWQLAQALPTPRDWAGPGWEADLVDALVVRLTGHPPSPASRDQALAFFADTPGNLPTRIRQLNVFIAQLPEVMAR